MVSESMREICFLMKGNIVFSFNRTRVLSALFLVALFAMAMTFVAGCKDKPSTSSTTGTADIPTFTLAWNQYPSSAVYPVAQELGLISPEKDKLGTLEQKWGIKLNLKETGYDTLLTLYGAKQVDAVTIVNLDALATSSDRAGVAIIPVSTSRGGDAVVAVNAVQNMSDLKGQTVYGLEKSVSQYMFERNLELAGLNPKDFTYKNMDPEQVAQALQTHQKQINAGAIWNPYIMQTLNTNKDTHVLFGSDKIPDEIVDVIWAGRDSLQKPGGDKFGALIADIYYEVNRQLKDPATHDKVATLLGQKTNGLSREQMDSEILVKTVFYPTAESAINLVTNKDWQTKNANVTKWAIAHGVVTGQPTVGYDDEKAQVNYSTKYAKMAAGK